MDENKDDRDQETVRYIIRILLPYHGEKEYEEITCTLSSHAVKMAIACTALGSIPDRRRYRPVVEIYSNAFPDESFGLYNHGDGFAIDMTLPCTQEVIDEGEKDSFGNRPELLTGNAFRLYSELKGLVTSMDQQNQAA